MQKLEHPTLVAAYPKDGGTAPTPTNTTKAAKDFTPEDADAFEQRLRSMPQILQIRFGH